MGEQYTDNSVELMLNMIIVRLGEINETLQEIASALNQPNRPIDLRPYFVDDGNS